ncbi:MAG: Do family serine endopeptidase [Rhodospirillales bacterium]|nr:Do family serine endopeptidase [Rhodospirillales bacterium]
MKQRITAVLGLLALSLLTGASTLAAEKVVPGSRAQVQFSYAPLVKKASPAVVNIYTRKVVRSRAMSPLFDDPFFQRFFQGTPGFSGSRKRVQNSLGSGVIVSADGLIVTNNHVIEGADEIRVVLTDRREFEAEVVGTDERTDLALLRVAINGEPLPFLPLSDSDDLEVGDIVLAIGNPFGVGQTVTSGIVSALSRTHVGVSDLASFIQTDAAINPGNSGGALIGMDARLVGINTAIFSKSGGSQGIGFAIPSNMVRAVVAGTLKGGKLVRAWFGAWGQAVSADIAQALGMTRPTGVLIKKVHPGGPAERAGIKAGDVIVRIKDAVVDDPKALTYRIATLPIGGKVVLSVISGNKERTLDLELTAPPEVPPRDLKELSGQHPLSGIVVANMSPALADEVGIEIFEEGVYILRLEGRGFASRLGLKPGDKIVTVNKHAIDNTRSLLAEMAIQVDSWAIGIKRDGKVMKLVIDR